jgi:hypothetical protein
LNSLLFLNNSGTFIGAGTTTQMCGVFPAGSGSGHAHIDLADLVNTTTNVNDTKITTGYIGFVGGALNSDREFKSKTGINSILSATAEIKIDYLAGNDQNGMNRPEETNILTFILLDAGGTEIASHVIWDPTVDNLVWPHGDHFDRITYPNDDISLANIQAAHAFKFKNPNTSNTSIVNGDLSHTTNTWVHISHPGPSTTLVGWEASGEVISIKSGNSDWGGVTSVSGTHYIALHTSFGSITQFVPPLSSGQTYTLSWSSRDRPTNITYAARKLKVSVGSIIGGIISWTTVRPFFTVTDLWTQYSDSFVATASAYPTAIKFESQILPAGSPQGSVFLDSISFVGPGGGYAVKNIELVPSSPKNFSAGGTAMAELIIIPRN